MQLHNCAVLRGLRRQGGEKLLAVLLPLALNSAIAQCDHLGPPLLQQCSEKAQERLA